MATWYRWPNDNVLEIQITVQPRASNPGIQGLQAGRLKLRVKSAPADGAANKEARSLLARLFNVPQSRVELHRGATNRQKVFRINRPAIGPETIEI